MWNDNGSTNQAILIDPFNISNLYLNYTIKNESKFSQTKIRLTINNLFDKHSIVAVKPASAASNLRLRATRSPCSRPVAYRSHDVRFRAEE
jgi:iron complex outermembrane receptor protein